MMVCATLWMTLTHQCSGNLNFRRKMGLEIAGTTVFCEQGPLVGWCPSDRQVASSVTDFYLLLYSLQFVMYIHGLGFISFTVLVSMMISIFLLTGSISFRMQIQKGKDQCRQST